MSEEQDTVEDYTVRAELCAFVADGFREPEARRWHKVPFIRRMIREYQDAAATWAQAARELQAVQP